MSHLRPTPAKLLLLISIGLLICVAMHERRSQRPAGSQTSPTVDSDPDGSRYPQRLVRRQDPVVLAGFTFDAPPLPDPTPAPQIEKSAPTPVQQPGSESRSKLPDVQETIDGPRKLSHSVLSRLPPIKKAEVKPQVWRLPSVDQQEKPSTPKVRHTQATKRAPVSRPSNGVAIVPIPAKAKQAATSEGSKRLPSKQPPANADQLTPDKEPIVRLATKPQRTIGTGVQASDSSSDAEETRKNVENDRPSIADRPAKEAVVHMKPVSSPIAPRPPARRMIPATQIPGPNPARVAVSRRAMALVRKGQSLAVRNAQYSARADFVQALRLIAQAEDEMHDGSQHSKSLAAGLLALQEAQDFVPSGRGRWSDQFDVQVISAAHGTPVIRELGHDGEPPSDMTPWQARQMYYTFAQKKLAQAGGDDAVASAALSSLGKLYVGRDGTADDESLVSSAQARSFFQAALRVDSRNYMAANELGVLLARYGQLQDARQVLQHGVAIEKDFPALWRNLAVVHQRMGELDLERRARKEFKLAQHRIESGQSQSEAGSAVRWVDAETFADLTPPTERRRTAEQPPAASDTTESEKPKWRFW